MKYFDLIDDLFDFKYLLTEDNLNELPGDMLENQEDLLTSVSAHVVEFDERMRRKRNVQAYFNIKKNMPLNETEIETIDELNNLIQFKSKTGSGADTVITNICIGARLQDMPEYKPTEVKDFTPTYPFISGIIGNLRIVIDPYLKYEDTVIYFYNKNSIKAAGYIKDISVENEATFEPVAKTTMTIFKKYASPVLKVSVKIPVEELI